jgi:hypothetical protein
MPIPVAECPIMAKRDTGHLEGAGKPRKYFTKGGFASVDDIKS